MATDKAHGEIVGRLNRAEGHLRSIVKMVEEGRECVDLAQQLHAVEKAITNAKRTLIHDHLDRCLAKGGGRSAEQALAEARALSKFL